MVDSSVALSSGLNIVGVDTRSSRSRVAALVGLLATVVVDVLEIKGVDVTRDVTENSQANVDKQIWYCVLEHKLYNGGDSGANLPIPHPETAHTPAGGTINTSTIVS